MLQRALRHPRGQAEHINIKVEQVAPDDIQFGRLPDIYSNQVQSWQQGRELAAEMLTGYGVSRQAVELALHHLSIGAAPGGQSMRGAMLIDADSGERLESDSSRGVRASRMDLAAATRRKLRKLLAAHGLDNPHVIEALTLAAKVLAAPGMIAELCWSDDPDYVAGYVCADGCYQRFNLLKPAGEERGGRAFFVRCHGRLPALIDWLQRQPFLINQLGRIHAPRQWQGSL